MAETAVYHRGEGIYQAQPIRVNKMGNVYEAKVWGTDKYEVTINLEAEEPDCYCTCPYNFEGICKHIVAVGLSIVDDKFSEKMTDFIEDAIVVSDPNFYKNVFLQAPSSQQSTFLQQLFEKNAAIQEQFSHFIQMDKKSFQTDDILKVRDAVHTKLNSLDVEFNYDDYYDDEGDGVLELGLEEVESVLKPYFKSAETKLQQGNLRGAVSILAGIYEGCHNLEEPVLGEDFEWSNYSDYETDVRAIFAEHLQQISNYLPTIITEQKNITAAINVLFERIYYYTEVPESKSHPMVYNLKDWEPLLLTFLTNKNIATDLLDMLREEELVDESTSIITLKIAELTEDEPLWLETAEANALHDPKIALQLLDKYYEAIEMSSFYRVAKAVFKSHSESLSSYLADIVAPEKDRAFYVKVISYHTHRYQSLEHYKRLREVMLPTEKKDFINSLRNDWRPQFYINVLEIEQDWDALLQLAKANTSTINYLLYLRPVAAARPEAGWEMTKERIKKLLESGTQGRDWYKTFANELFTIGNISSQRMHQARAFASSLLSTYPRLRAMKEEFRRVGLG